MDVFTDWTASELTGFRKELGKAIASGALTVRFADRQVTYRSLDEMRSASEMLTQALADKAGTRRARRLLVDTRKGF